MAFFNIIPWKRCVLFLFVSIYISFPSQAQNSSLLTIENLTNGTFSEKRTSPGKWLTQEVGYINIEKKGTELVLHTPSGKRTALLSLRGISILNYRFSPDESKILLNVEAKGQQQFYVFDRDTESTSKTNLDSYYPDIQMIKWSPDNKYISFSHEANIYAYDLEKKESIQLTNDGSDVIINSTASFEFSSVQSSTEYQWSPDSKYIAFNQFNTEGIGSFSIINNLDSIYSSVKQSQYVKPGETLPSVRTGVIEVSTKNITWLNVNGDSRNHYIYHLTWNPGSNELFVQQLNRKQNTMNILRADVETGTMTKVFAESEKTFIEPFELKWIYNGKNFLWMSENDGWRHIYSISTDGQNKQLLTPGDFDVSYFRGADNANKWLYFEASPTNTLHNYLYRVKLDGSSKHERLTPTNWVGTNNYNISPNGKWAFHTHSRFHQPRVQWLVKLSNHAQVKMIDSNVLLKTKINKIKPTPVEYSKIEIEDGVSLDSWMIKPPNFDTEKKYPIIFHVYSMPAAKSTNDRWKGSNYFFYQLLAKQGFIVMGIDGRGTPALVGKDWRKSIYLKHGVLPADDIAKATKMMLQERPFMDPERIGVFGWSGGGLMSLMLILRHPDVFDTAIPGAYLSHHKYYHAGFTERFLGTPQDNPEAYEETAVINYAKNLKGNLLLMHGTGDDNVHYQNTDALINKLIEEKRRFVALPYPNRNHNMRQGKNTRYHRYDTYLWFFTEHLNPGE